MGKVKTSKRGTAGSSPYDRPSGAKTAAAQATKNNIFKFNTNLGQHILKNPSIAEQIVAKANLKETDHVLEVGPGSGNLTVRILDKARKVTAVELDPRMAAEVTKRVQGTPLAKKFECMLGDVIKVDLPPFDVCISNTPYQISSPLVFKLLSMPNPPRTSVLMFQREFAMRLVARPGDALYGRLAVNAQFFAKISLVMKVGKNNFRPPPEVESSVVRIEPKTGKDRPQVDFGEWDGMLRVCFVRKNKTLRASWLGTREVLAMVERNYRTYCSMQNIPLEDGAVEDGGEQDGMELDDGHGAASAGADEDEEWGGIMDVDEGGGVGGGDDDDDTPAFFKELKQAAEASQPPKTPGKRKRSKVAELVRNKIIKVLESTGLADRRASKCDENDFLRLLFAFHGEGLHFA